MRKGLFLLIMVTFVALSPSLWAVEVYSFFDQSCKETVGYIVNSTKTHIQLLTYQGDAKILEKEQVKGVLVYSFVKPPIKKIANSKLNREAIKVLTVEENGEYSTFNGFPVKFIEELVVFMGLDGAVGVYDPKSLLKVRPYKKKSLSQKIHNNGLSIHSSGYIQSCPSAGKRGKVKPNRILVDTIKVRQFFKNYQKGFDALESFEERTYLYARPLLFDQRAEFGLLNSSAIEQSSSNVALDALPYIKWSSGEPYGVQNLNHIGSITSEYGDDLDPFIGVKAEVKAHFFHAAFIGNLLGIAAGSSFLIQSNGLDGTDSKSKIRANVFDSTINYSALFGGDYGKHSFSLGITYPIYVLAAGTEIREVLSTKNAYLLRYMYTTKRFRYFATGSLNEDSVQNPTRENILSYSLSNDGYFDRSTVSSFKIQSKFIRFGIDFTPEKGTVLGASGLLAQYDYQENSTNSVLLDRMGGRVFVKKTFGDYISLGGNLNYLLEDSSFKIGGVNQTDSKGYFGFGFEAGLVF